MRAALPASWPGDFSFDPQVINQVAITFDQGNPELVYLMFGHIGPPLWMTDDAVEQGIAQYEAEGGVPVTTRGSFVVSRTRAIEIWESMGRMLGTLPGQ